MTFAPVLLLALLVGTAGVLAYSIGVGIGVLAECRDELRGLRAGPEAGYRRRLDEIEHRVELLPMRWEEFTREAKRSEDRARAVARDALKQLAESGQDHAGVRAQAAELRIVDGSERTGEGLSPVPNDMEGAQAGLQDWQVAGLRRKFGGD